MKMKSDELYHNFIKEEKVQTKHKKMCLRNPAQSQSN